MAGLMKLEMTVPFETSRDAEIVCNSLGADREPKRSEVIKTLRVEGSTLHVCFEAKEVRSLRVASGSFMDLLILTMDTITQFRPATSEQ